MSKSVNSDIEMTTVMPVPRSNRYALSPSLSLSSPSSSLSSSSSTMLPTVPSNLGSIHSIQKMESVLSKDIVDETTALTEDRTSSLPALITEHVSVEKKKPKEKKDIEKAVVRDYVFCVGENDNDDGQ